MEAIQYSLIGLDLLLAEQPHNHEQIQSTLKNLDEEIKQLEDEDYDAYGYFKYVVSEKCISLYQNNNQKHLNNLKKFKEEHANFQQQNENLMQKEENIDVDGLKNSLEEEQKQSIQSKLVLLDRQLRQGGTTGIAEIGNSTSVAVKAYSGLKQVIRSSSPLFHAAIEISKKATVNIVDVTAKACFSKANIFTSLGLLATEASIIYFQYRKDIKNCKSDEERQLAENHFKQSLKALGARATSSFALTSILTIGGAAIGKLFGGIGSILGAIAGSVIGGGSSYLLDKNYWNPLFFEKKDYILECEKELGLDNFYNENNKTYTKEEFDFKVKRCLLLEHPDKQPTDALKANARAKIFKILLAKEMILKKRKWNK